MELAVANREAAMTEESDPRPDGLSDRVGYLGGRVEEMSKRIDDLSNRVDEGFRQVDGRFSQLEGRFDALQRTLMQLGGGLLAAFVAALVGLIATQV